MNRHLLPLLALALAPSAAAQIGFSSPRGIAGSLAAALSLSESTRSTALDFVLDKPPTSQVNPPAPWDPTSFRASPDYSLEGMFGKVNGVDLSAVVEIDAHSTGADFLPPFDSTTGEAIMNLNWLALAASFDNAAQGMAGSFLQERLSVAPGVRGTPGADLTSYYFQQSTGIGSFLPGQTILEQNAEELGLGGTSDADVDALDYGLNVLAHAQRTTPLLTFPFPPGSYFFSLARECVDQVNVDTGGQFALDASGTLVAADACAIYRIDWTDPGTGYVWDTPTVYRSAADLDLDPNDPLHDLDALAVNAVPGANVLLFSTHVTPSTSPFPWSQIRVNQLDFFGNSDNFDARDGGALVTQRIGGVDYDDNIDALCGWDPADFALDTHVGYPTRVMKMGGNEVLGISMTRASEGAVERIHFRISGYSTSLVGSSYTLWFTTGLGYNLPPGVSSTSLPWVPINSGQLKAEGDPLVVSIDLPDGLVLPNCAVFVSVTNDLGLPLASSWITQFNID